MWKLAHKECWGLKNWCCWILVWRRLLRVLLTANRPNQSILKEINSEYSLEGLMLKLKLQYFGLLTWTADSLEKSLMLVKIEGKKRRGRQRMRWLDGINDSMDLGLSKFCGMVKDREAWRAVHGATKSQTQLRDWRTCHGYSLVIMELTSSPGVLVSTRQFTEYCSEYYL